MLTLLSATLAGTSNVHPVPVGARRAPPGSPHVWLAAPEPAARPPSGACADSAGRLSPLGPWQAHRTTSLADAEGAAAALSAATASTTPVASLNLSPRRRSRCAGRSQSRSASAARPAP